MTQSTDNTSDGNEKFAVPPGMLGKDAPTLTYDEIQALVDRSATYHFYTAPGSVSAAPVQGSGGVIGFSTEQPVHRFDIDMGPPSDETGLQATNVTREKVGTLRMRWLFIPWDFSALPTREPPPTVYDPTRTQRFVMQEMVLALDSETRFESFGAGRTYPMLLGGRPQVSAGAVGDILKGRGRFKGVEGNYTLCGQLMPDFGFSGHIMLRLVDADGKYRAASLETDPKPPAEQLSGAESGITYLSYFAQKGNKTKSENVFSLMPDGTPRGVNIPVDLKEIHLDGATLAPGPVVGLEIGFGRETKPRGPHSGSALDPFQFEGVSEYYFYDSSGRTIATFAANFLEGRTFAMELDGAPGIPALRFGYYGIITGGTGFLEGLQGFLYGTAGSVFMPPPSEHVISNLYVARVSDPDGRFRALMGG